VLRHGDRYLMLQRGADRVYAPGRWTGVGGHVEPHELDDLRGSALRELREEAGIAPDDVDHFTLRRVLLCVGADFERIALILYYSGALRERVEPECDEGTLHWLGEDEIAGLDVIESTRHVLPLLFGDERRDPGGSEPYRSGIELYPAGSRASQVTWA
jgi:8-oxo-dGTP diphosphatase